MKEAIYTFITSCNDFVVYYTSYMWQGMSKETVYNVWQWVKLNWVYINTPETRQFILEGIKVWADRERAGFVKNLDGPYGITTLIYLFLICAALGIVLFDFAPYMEDTNAGRDFKKSMTITEQWERTNQQRQWLLEDQRSLKGPSFRKEFRF